MPILEDLHALRDETLKAIAAAADAASLKSKETEYLGRKGKLTLILRSIAAMGDEAKRSIGAASNQVKKELGEAFKEAIAKAEAAAGRESLDVTLPGRSFPNGHAHPISETFDRLTDLFGTLGFTVLEGPELESDYFNFEALNIPPHAPARDSQDTFYIAREPGAERLVMRTHTSPMQVRAMKTYGAPLRCVVPGRAFRNEATDAAHDDTFYQLEGLMVDRGISIAHLISVMKEALGGIFEQTATLRVRPGHFNFVEPGIEVDIRCTICGGSGCPSCKHNGWLEMIGAGMVHPNVLRAGGIDPETFTGFAFGMGVDRLAMMKYGITDIRLFHSGDLRFLNQL